MRNILLIHGIWGGNWFWDKWKPVLINYGYNCISPTLSNLMNTDYSPGAVHYAESIIEQNKSHKFDYIIGFSSGAIIAALIANKIINIKGVIFICPVPPFGCFPAVSKSTISFLPTFYTKVLLNHNNWIPPIERSIITLGMTHVPEAQSKELFQLFLPESRRFLIEMCTQQVHVNYNLLPGKRLLIGAKQDKAIPNYSVRSFGKKIARKPHFIDNSGHLLPIEAEGSKVINKIINWLE